MSDAVDHIDTKKLKVFDLFSGVGGFSYGLEKTGQYETVAFCEIEKYCREVLKKHWASVPIFEDVTDLKDKPFDLDLLVGGFPCTNISIAGKGDGINGEHSKLWFEYKRLINEWRPKYAIIENVSALLCRGLETILQNLAEIGYDATYTTLDSKYFGVPHRRRRVYILAVRDGILPESDILKFTERDSEELREKMEAVEKSFEWDFTKVSEESYPFAYYTRQRSDEFACCGVSSTILKRDYKDFTDVVTDSQGVRRVTPQERMLLQGLPSDWLDDSGLSNTQKFKCNAMTANVISWLGGRLYDYDQSIQLQ